MAHEKVAKQTVPAVLGTPGDCDDRGDINVTPDRRGIGNTHFLAQQSLSGREPQGRSANGFFLCICFLDTGEVVPDSYAWTDWK